MKIKIYLFRIISVLVGAFFVLSALVKLYPIEILEIAIVETGFVGWSLASVTARLLIGSELFIGVFLMTNFKTKLFSILAGLSLFIFTIYLVVLLIAQGNNINCNCMGLFMVMNPIESMVKNVILFCLLTLLYFKNTSIRIKKENLVIGIITVIIFIIPFMVNPITFEKGKYEINSNENRKMDFSIIYSNSDIEQPKIDLTTGKHLVGFFSSTCQHCVVSGYNLKVLFNQHPEWSMYFFINGDDADLAHFHTLTKSESVPHSKLPGKELLLMAGNKLPAIFLINNSSIEQRISPDNIDETFINNWFLN